MGPVKLRYSPHFLNQHRPGIHALAIFFLRGMIRTVISSFNRLICVFIDLLILGPQSSPEDAIELYIISAQGEFT